MFWSSVSSQPYLISLRVLSFEHKYAPLDPGYERETIETFAQTVREQFPAPPGETWESLLYEIATNDPAFDAEENELADLD